MSNRVSVTTEKSGGSRNVITTIETEGAGYWEVIQGTMSGSDRVFWTVRHDGWELLNEQNAPHFQRDTARILTRVAALPEMVRELLPARWY